MCEIPKKNKRDTNWHAEGVKIQKRSVIAFTLMNVAVCIWMLLTGNADFEAVRMIYLYSILIGLIFMLSCWMFGGLLSVLRVSIAGTFLWIGFHTLDTMKVLGVACAICLLFT